jgi:hypothetical protein
MQDAVWKVKGLEVSEVEGHKDCVVRIHFSTTKGSRVFTGDHCIIFSDNGFIAFEDLTEQIVMGWLKNSLGSHGVSKVESKLVDAPMQQTSNEAFKNEAVEVQLPWVKG